MIDMKNRLMMSVAAVAMIAGGNFAYAQGAGQGGGMSREAPGGAPTARSAPAAGAPAAADRAAPAEHSAPMKRDEASDTTNKSEQSPPTKTGQSDDKMQRDNGNQRATDTTRDNGRADKDAKSTADSKSPNDAKTDAKSSTTTGQAAAGGKLTSEQRTKVTTVIKQQNIKPVTNVNFSISVGTRVPRDVEFHPLPTEIVTVYPDWRGYDFVLVNDQIIVINPRTYEIVAVIDA
jgi:hypothetical protein